MNELRLATPDDLSAIYALDPLIAQHPVREAVVRRAVAAQQCWVAAEANVCGYAILEYTFYEQGFIPLLYVEASWRQQGVGAALLQHLATQCTTPKLFTSTNLSNRPMQALLAKLGYKLTGIIHDLDEGDPELVYVKYLG